MESFRRAARLVPPTNGRPRSCICVDSLLAPDGCYGIDLGRAGGRNEAGHEHDNRKYGRHGQENPGVIRADLKEHAAHETHQRESRPESRASAQCCPLHSLAKKESKDLTLLGAERHTHADVMPALEI